jgi:hypothetical protein
MSESESSNAASWRTCNNMEEGDEDDSDAEELLEGDEEDSVKLVVRVVDSLKERDIMLRFLRRGFMLVVVAVREDSNDLGRERERGGERERERGVTG